MTYNAMKYVYPAIAKERNINFSQILQQAIRKERGVA